MVLSVFGGEPIVVEYGVWLLVGCFKPREKTARVSGDYHSWETYGVGGRYCIRTLRVSLVHLT